MTQRASRRIAPGVRQEIARLLEARFGLVFPDARGPLLDQSVRDALDRLGETAPSELLARLHGEDTGAWAALAAAATVGETYFFREPAHYEFLRGLLCAAAPDHRVRLWSAACASGAEAYSMAAVACEVFGDRAPERVTILGTDIDPDALRIARAGLYRPWTLRATDNATRQRWFTREDALWRVRDSLRKLVSFARLNLADPGDRAWPAAMDVTFCRNVLVYLSEEAVERACQGLCAALVPGGWLVTGPTAPLLAHPALALDATPGFIAYRRRAPAHAPAVAPCLALPDRAAPVSWRCPAPRASRPPPAPHPLRSQAPPLHAPGPPAPDALARARALADAGDAHAAIQELDHVLAQEPFSAESYLLRATLRQVLRDHPGVITETRRALLLDRQLAYAHVLAAISHIAMGDRIQAQRALRNARTLLAAVPADTIVTGTGTSAAELHAACRQLVHALDRQPQPRKS